MEVEWAPELLGQALPFGISQLCPRKPESNNGQEASRPWHQKALVEMQGRATPGRPQKAGELRGLPLGLCCVDEAVHETGGHSVPAGLCLLTASLPIQAALRGPCQSLVMQTSGHQQGSLFRHSRPKRGVLLGSKGEARS